LYEPLAQEKHIAFNCRTGSRICQGEADLLFQMFANLLDNAIKYTPEGGAIDLVLESSTEQGHSVLISDTGPGIDPADRDSVFRRFFRLESSRSEQPGHGLGLSLVRAIAEYHGGGVRVLDNKPGLQVRVNLPG